MKYGLNQTDMEQRIDMDKLRRDRLAKAQQALKDSDADALLLFDCNNVRYTTSTWLGEWARDKLMRYVILPQEGKPQLYEFGSAVPHKQIMCPWISENVHPSSSAMRGTIPEEAGLEKEIVDLLVDGLKEHGLSKCKIGVDMMEVPVMQGLLDNGFTIVNGQKVMLEARRVKTLEEIVLLEYAAATVDAGYSEIIRNLRAGIRENELVAIMNDVCYRRGCDQVEAVNCISGPRCHPHPHNFSDRLIRPGEFVYMDVITAFCGYRTCYYRTFHVGKADKKAHEAYKKTYDWLYAAIELVKPGMTTKDICSVWPKAQEFGFKDEAHAFALQFGHGIGLSVWEYPVISRRVSLDLPLPIEEGMTFALETYCPTDDDTGGAARIEEMCVVSDKGCRVITKYPCEELICVDP